MKSHVFAVLYAVLFTLSNVVAQERVSLHTDFDMFLDDKEFATTRYGMRGVDFERGTDLFGRLSLSAELGWDEVNSLVVGGEFTSNYGEQGSKFFSSIKPIIHYRYQGDNLKLIAGIYRNDELKINSYSTAFYSETYRNVVNRLSGALVSYERDNYNLEVALNWCGEHTATTRERFEVLSSARGYIGENIYVGYNYLMYHFAGSSDPKQNSLVDLQRINPCVGVTFGSELGVDFKMGAIISPQRDRNFKNEWDVPMMGEAALLLKYRGFTLDQRLYFGENQNPYFAGHRLPNGHHMIYGMELYRNESFFRTERGFYNRTAVGYNKSISNDSVQLRVAAIVHYDGYGVGTQYILEARVRLFQDLYNRKKSIK